MGRHSDLREPMSSKKDPRVLQKEGKTVFMASTTRQSKGRKYHKNGCDALAKIKGEPKEVDIAVARWKGMQPCAKCLTQNRSHDPSLTGRDVDRIRRALVALDVSNTDIASGYDVAPATVRYHATATRDYDYRVEPTTPTIEFDRSAKTYRWADE